MKSLSTVGLGLSVVFGCLLFALVAEIYYLLWWKRRRIGRELEDDEYTNPSARLTFYIFCWKTQKNHPPPPSLNLREEGLPENPLAQHHSSVESEFDQFNPLHHNKDSWLLKPFDEDGGVVDPSCFPRFLFTINEETKEDLESEDGKSRIESKRLSDLFNTSAETPFFTPMSSPAFFTPPITPTSLMVSSCHSHSLSNGSAGYNPFFESSTDVEFNKVRSSPPPNFKFLRDAEDKLQRRTSSIENAQNGSCRSTSSYCSSKATNASTPELQQKGE